MPSKTLILKIEADEGTQAVLRNYAKASAKWEQEVFGQWYADFRAHRSNLSRSRYAGLVSTKTISARAVGKKGGRVKYQVNVKKKTPNLYSLLVTKKSRIEPSPRTQIKSGMLLGILSHLGTQMENFIDYDLRSSRAHDRRIKRRQREAHARKFNSSAPDIWDPPNFYPKFKPIARFHHQAVDWKFESGDAVLLLTHPFEKNQKMKVHVVPSDDERFQARLKLLKAHVESGHGVAVEIKYHDDGSRRVGWYLHASVPLPEMDPVESPKMIMGVDVGERNPASAVVIDGPNGSTDRVGVPKTYHGLQTRDVLERTNRRVARLRRAADRGSQNARKALLSAKGKKRRILNTMAHQVSADIVQTAVASGVEVIAMEDLARFVPGAKHGQLNRKGKRRFPIWGKKGRDLRRRLSGWNRGDVQSMIRYKAEMEGIRLAGPQGRGIYARGTSSTCPKCGKFEPQARDRTSHAFTCRETECGYSDNDDLTGAANIAARGWVYFHSPKASSSVRPVDGVVHYPSGKPGHVSTRIDPAGPLGLAGGSSSTTQATMGGLAGPHPQPTEKPENGARRPVAAQAAKLSSPTGGDGRGIVEPTTSQSDKATGALKSPGFASAKEVTPHPVGARKRKYRRKTTSETPANASETSSSKGGARKNHDSSR